MSHYFPDPDTGYVDDDPLIQAQDEEHEAEEEARMLDELEAAQSSETYRSWPVGVPDYYRDQQLRELRKWAHGVQRVMKQKEVA
jgi:hypothetical protein